MTKNTNYEGTEKLLKRLFGDDVSIKFTGSTFDKESDGKTKVKEYSTLNDFLTAVLGKGNDYLKELTDSIDKKLSETDTTPVKKSDSSSKTTTLSINERLKDECSEQYKKSHTDELNHIVDTVIDILSDDTVEHVFYKGTDTVPDAVEVRIPVDTVKTTLDNTDDIDKVCNSIKSKCDFTYVTKTTDKDTKEHVFYCVLK